MYSAQTQQKEVKKMASLISPPRRKRARFSTIPSPCGVPHQVTACPCVACTGQAQAYSVALKLTSDLPSRFSKPNAPTCFHIVAWSKCFVPKSLAFSEPFFRLSRISFSVMCFWSHSVRVSKCLILPTPLLAPNPLAAEASPAMGPTDHVPGLCTSSSNQ